MTAPPILSIKNLSVRFPARRGFFGRVAAWSNALDGVSLDIAGGETLGLVGESGCGKTTLSRAVLRLVKPAAGSILFEGRDIAALAPAELPAYRRAVQAVFQDPFASLNPRLTVERIVADGAVAHGLVASGRRRDFAARLLAEVGIGEDALDRFPHEFSGGQRQRISIARAISVNPRLLVCDEAVSALDLTVRAQVLELLAALKASRHLSMLFITHDIGVVAKIADRIAVMNRGRIVECGAACEVAGSPQADYTKKLILAVPRISGAAGVREGVAI